MKDRGRSGRVRDGGGAFEQPRGDTLDHAHAQVVVTDAAEQPLGFLGEQHGGRVGIVGQDGLAQPVA